MQDVGRQFTSGENCTRALGRINLCIGRGEHVAIEGPSGSGKTTLMHILGCLDTPTSGSYTLNGRLVSQLDDADLSRIRNDEIGFVFQSFHMLARCTAEQNVALPLLYGSTPPTRRSCLAREALNAVGLAHRANYFPNQLSGGQCQRVAIARALVNRPAMLLADEPTGALDRRTGGQIMALLERIHADGMTLVVVTHDVSVARRAGRRILLEDGKICADARVA